MASSTQSLYSAQISGSENDETRTISRFSFNSSEPGINSSQSSHPILPEPTPTGTTDTNGVAEHPLDRLRYQNPSNQNPEAIKSYIRRRRNLRVWWFEILMCFVMIGALLAIVATLLSYHDQPIPHWPYGISINAIISIYITILKAVLVALVSQGLGQLKWTWFKRPRPLNDLGTFDNASRGLIGAISLLWSIRGRDVIASSGAVVFVLSTILDPFSQQTVRFYSCRRLDDSGTKASINTTNYISVTHGPIGPNGIGEISLAMQIEIQKAIIDSTEARVSFYCPSGNCTFTSGYKSIGFCNSCADTSDHINVFQDPNGKFTNYSTPVFTLTHETTTETGSFGMSYNDSSSGIDYNDPPSGAMHFYSIAAWSKKLPESACTTAETNPWRCRGYGAAVCTISPCVQTLTSTVELNQLHEVEIAPSGAVWGKTDGTNIGRTIDTSCVNQTEKNILQAKGYEFDKDTPWIPFRIAWPARENDAYAEIRRECVYEYDAWDIDAISLFAKDHFEGIAISGASDPVTGNYNTGSIHLLEIFNNGTIDFHRYRATFNRIANAMGVFSRQNPKKRESLDGSLSNMPQAVHKIPGDIYYNDTCVEVRWQWLSYPAVLCLFTLLFFAGMVIETRWLSSDEGSWHDYKADALPLLFHGLERNTLCDQNPGVTSSSFWTDQAKQFRVRFEKVNGAWKFVEV